MRAPPRPEQIAADERMVPLSVHQGAVMALRAARERAETAEARVRELVVGEAQLVDLLAVELEIVRALRRGGVLRDDETPTTVELVVLLKRMRGEPV